MLKTRILTALALAAAFIPALFYLNSIYWAVLILLLSLLGLTELTSMAKFTRTQTMAYLALTAAAGAVALVYLVDDNFHAFSNSALLAFAITAVFWALLVPIWLAKKWYLQSRIGVALLGWVLFVPLWMALVWAHRASPGLVLIFLATIWIADSAAYLAGKNFGKHKLAPNISPNKTWEGVLGALLGVAVFAVALVLSGQVGATVPALLALLWVCTIFGVIGDLFESMLKRQAGVKDSGNLLPGHGGILDRIDGIIPSVPIGILLIYFYSYFVALG